MKTGNVIKNNAKDLKVVLEVLNDKSLKCIDFFGVVGVYETKNHKTHSVSFKVFVNSINK